MIAMMRTGSPPGTIRMVTMIVKRTIGDIEKDEDFFFFHFEKLCRAKC